MRHEIHEGKIIKTSISNFQVNEQNKKAHEPW